MTEKQRKAYDWAKNQKFTSVSALYARILAELVDELQAKIKYISFDKGMKNCECLGEAADGRMAVLPVNIGQKVWFLLEDAQCFYPDTNGWYLSEETVTAAASNCFLIDGFNFDTVTYPFEQIGKTIFLTREEAEAALGARKGESHEHHD